MTWQDDVRAMFARAAVLASDTSLSDEQRVETMMREFNVCEMEAWQHVEMASPGLWRCCEVILDGPAEPGPP